MVILDNMLIQELSSASDYFKQVSKTLINSINIILVLHRNFIPNYNPSLLEDWKHVTIIFESSHRVFMDSKRNLEA